jgi:hypothetical protein
MYLSPEMVQELALGMDPPLDIAKRYGVDYREYTWLEAQPWFGELIAKTRMEQHAEGITFAAKAKMMAEELFQTLFQAATTGNLAHTLSLDLAKQLTEIAGLKPKVTPGQGASGPAFQININVNSEGALKSGQRPIEGSAVEVKPVKMSIPLDNLPPKPEGFRVPDFRLTSDLVGTPQAVQAAQSVQPAR